MTWINVETIHKRNYVGYMFFMQDCVKSKNILEKTGIELYEAIFEKFKHQFPYDAVLMGGSFDRDRFAIILTVVSKSFHDVPIGESMPITKIINNVIKGKKLKARSVGDSMP